MKRKISLKVKLLLLVFLSLAVLSSLLTTMSVTSAKDIGKKLVEEKAVGILNAEVTNIDKQRFYELSKSLDKKDNYYNELFNKFVEIKEKNGLAYLYVLKIDGDKATIIVDGDANVETQVQIGTDGELNSEAINHLKKGENYIEKAYYTEQWGWLITAYVPVKNEQGKTIGVLAADIDVDDLNAKLNKNRNLLILYSVIATLIILFLSSIFSVRITNAIGKFLLEFEKLSKGDLDINMDESRNDEIGEMSKRTNEFSKKLSDIISDIKKLATTVETENKELNYSIDNLVKGKKSKYFSESNVENGIIQLEEYVDKVLDNVRNQTAASEETLASLEEITATTGQIRDNTKRISQGSGKTLTNAINSSKSVENMSLGMEAIKESVLLSTKKVEELSNLSKNIDSVIEVIKNISEQTNLLALNASIEAARAGEAGRGFNVVAGEIKKLAEKTTNETFKIEETVRAITTEVEEVRGANKQVEADIERGMGYTLDVKENISSILENIKENDLQIQAIATSTEEQLMASTEITRAANDITENATEIESLGLDTHNIAKVLSKELQMKLEIITHLSETAKNLKEDLEFFKVK